MFEVVFDNNIQLKDAVINKNFIKTDVLKKSVNPLYLSIPFKSKSKISRSNRLFNLGSKNLNSIDFDKLDISHKLGTILSNNVSELKFSSQSGMNLEGKIHVRGDKHASFKAKFNSINEMKQYFGFVADLYFLKENIGQNFKCTLGKKGNIKFFTSSRKQVTIDNINNHLIDSLKENQQKLDNLKKHTFKIEKAIDKLDKEVSSVNLKNDQLNLKIEEFSLCENNFKNALKYYFIQKDNSIYKKMKSHFNKNSSTEKNKSLGVMASSSSDNSQFQEENTQKNHEITINDKEEAKIALERVVKEVDIEQSKKRRLNQKYNTLKKAYKKVINNKETFNYVLNKIKENSNSIFKIMKYRKQVIKDLKIYGFRLQTF